MKRIISLFIVILFFISPVIAKEKIKVSRLDTGVYAFKINTKKYGDKIKPYIVDKPVEPKKLYKNNEFDLVVNGGFFDVRSGKSVSYVTINNKMVSDIYDNATLINNLTKQDRLDKVVSRAELRVLENKRGKLKFDIARHDKKVKRGYQIKHALQAGPMLYPTMDLVNEGFVVYENDMVKSQSVDILKRRERTIVGLKGNNLYIVLFTKDHKVDANEAREYIRKKLKLRKILALDGGLSTAIDCKDISIGSMGKYQRKVKSFLVIEK